MFNLFEKYKMDFVIVGDKLQTINLNTYNTKSPMSLNAELLKNKYNRDIEVSENICKRM